MPISLSDWMELSCSQNVINKLTAASAVEDFQAVIHAAQRFDELDWVAAVAILHMVYGWMPTMLRPIPHHSPAQRDELLRCLVAVRDGNFLGSDDLTIVERFANGSIVGASKLLHVLNPENYVIWDSRVAKVFLWSNVSRQTYCTVPRLQEYLQTIQRWARDQSVQERCQHLRDLNPLFVEATNLRMIELVLFNGNR
jgi:hypothetical protein